MNTAPIYSNLFMLEHISFGEALHGNYLERRYMATIEERVSAIEGTIPHLATKADLKDLEVRLTRTMYMLGVGLLITFFSVVVNILVSILR